jgi:hypothetical protein
MRGHGKEMMHDKAMRLFGAVISSLVCGAFVACAGGDTPPLDDELGDAISQTYGNGAVAGGAGPTGSAGRAGGVAAPAGGRSGSGSGSGGQAPTGGAGGSGNPTASGGAGGTPTGEDPPPSSGTCDGFAVLKLRCDGPNCHGDGGLGNFAATEEDARAFVGVSGTISCSSEGPLLDPENPRQSVIIQKVLGTATCGAEMPLGAGGPLTDEQVSCLEDWIASL